MTAESFVVSEDFGDSGDTVLMIGKYNDITDTAGVPPTVRITSPAEGDVVIAGSTITVTLLASDDVAPKEATVSVNGQVVAGGLREPFSTSFIAPSGVSSLVIGATVTDYGENIGTAPDVSVSVIPDPLTTVRGTVRRNGTPVEAAALDLGTLRTLTDAAGSYQFSGVGTISGPVTVTATIFVDGEVLGGRGSASPVRGGVTTIDIAVAPLTVGTVGYMTIPAPGQGVDVAGQIAVVAMGDSGLGLYDFSNPLAPTAVRAPFVLSGPARDVRVIGSIAFVAADVAGVVVLDITNPVAPAVLATITDATGATALAVEGSVLFALCGAGGLRAYDVSHPDAPAFLGEFTGNSDLTRMAVFESTVVVSETTIPSEYGGSESTTIDVIDASDPTAMFRAAGTNVTGEVSSIAMVDDRIFIAADTWTLAEYQFFDGTPWSIDTVSLDFSAAAMKTVGTNLIAAGRSADSDSLARLYDLSALPATVAPGSFEGPPFSGDAITVQGPYAIVPAHSIGSSDARLFILKYRP